MSKTSEQHVVDPSVGASTPGRGSILLVDQQAYYRSFARQTLEAEGFQVDVEATYEHFALPKNTDYDAIILGCQSVGQAEEAYILQASQSKIPVYVLAAEAIYPASIRAAMLSGAQNILPKPLGCASLKRALQAFRM